MASVIWSVGRQMPSETSKKPYYLVCRRKLRNPGNVKKTILSGRPNPYLVGGHLHRSLLEFQKNHIIWSGSHIIWSGSHIIWSEGGQRHSIASIATLIVDGWVSGLELSGREAILSGYLVCEPFLRQPWKCQKNHIIWSAKPLSGRWDFRLNS